MVGSPDPVLYFLSATAALKFIVAYLNHKSVPKQAKCVGKISRITLFPLKSSRGIDLDSAECTFSGLKMTEKNILDRHWLVVNEENRFITGRQEPKLTTILPSFHGDWLQLDAPGMDSLKIPQNIKANQTNVVDAIVWGEDIQGVDCGPEAALWLNKMLGRTDLRLIFCSSEVRLRKLASKTDDQWFRTAKDIDEVAYQDAAPFMLLSEASLADGNTKLPKGVKEVGMEQFRPNLVATGCSAFDEDAWKEVYIGGVKFTNIKPCDRCILTTVNPQTGTKHPDMEPLKTLRSYRLLEPKFEQAPCFGVNFVADWTGTIHVGDEIWATK